jgi:catechol 2,3-dioxygenase-like lactoylglutathione lyase family enzyme
MPPKLTSLDHLVLTVQSIDETVAFYQGVLGMTAKQFPAADGTVRWALSFGQQKINLHQAGAEFKPHAETPMRGSADLCFLSDASLSEWQKHLEQNGVAVIEGPVARSGATGPITSVYVRDPDGNLIEIANQA